MVSPATKLAATAGWHTVFMIGVCFNLVAAGLGLFVLKPMRERHFAQIRDAAAAAGTLARSPSG